MHDVRKDLTAGSLPVSLEFGLMVVGVEIRIKFSLQTVSPQCNVERGIRPLSGPLRE